MRAESFIETEGLPVPVSAQNSGGRAMDRPSDLYIWVDGRADTWGKRWLTRDNEASVCALFIMKWKKGNGPTIVTRGGPQPPEALQLIAGSWYDSRGPLSGSLSCSRAY